MNKFGCLIFTIFFIVLSVRAQEINHSITYAATIIKKLDNKTKSSSMNEIYAIMEKTNVQFKLLINNNKSLYKAKNELVEKTFHTEIARLLYGATDKFYISLDDSEFINEVNAYGDRFLIPIEKRYWELSKDSKKIGGYTCYKATTTYSVTNDAGSFDKLVTAWYAPKIKGRFGPRGYYGLPGLILQLQDDKFLFTVTNIHLNQKKPEKIIKPKKGKKISLKEFYDLEYLYTKYRE